MLLREAAGVCFINHGLVPRRFRQPIVLPEKRIVHDNRERSTVSVVTRIERQILRRVSDFITEH